MRYWHTSKFDSILLELFIIPIYIFLLSLSSFIEVFESHELYWVFDEHSVQYGIISLYYREKSRIPWENKGRGREESLIGYADFLDTLGLQRSLPSIELDPLIVVIHIARANLILILISRDLVFLFRTQCYFIDISAKVYLKGYLKHLKPQPGSIR